MTNEPLTDAELADLRHLANENGSTLAFLNQIIKDNKLHESHCVAFSTSKDSTGLFGSLTFSSEKYCHCWLDRENRAPEGEGFGIYDIKNEELLQELFFVNNYFAVKNLLKDHPELSKQPSDDNYWRKFFYIIPVSLQPATLTPTESAN